MPLCCTHTGLKTSLCVGPASVCGAVQTTPWTGTPPKPHQASCNNKLDQTNKYWNNNTVKSISTEMLRWITKVRKKAPSETERTQKDCDRNSQQELQCGSFPCAALLHWKFGLSHYSNSTFTSGQVVTFTLVQNTFWSFWPLRALYIHTYEL